MSKFSRMRKGGAFAAGMVALVGAWEGLSYKAYLDIVNVPTICYGETKGVRMGQTATKAECDAMLVQSLIKHEDGMLACLNREMPESVHKSALSLTYNVGVGAWCKSTAAKLVNAGRFKEACDAMTRFNRAGGKIIRGLVNRRAAEYKICVQDL